MIFFVQEGNKERWRARCGFASGKTSPPGEASATAQSFCLPWHERLFFSHHHFIKIAKIITRYHMFTFWRLVLGSNRTNPERLLPA